MNLGDINALVTVVDTGSLARAAVKLRLTQPAITRRIQRLEDTLGAKLLDRDVKPARLTAEGRTAYAECVRVLNAADGLRGALVGAVDVARPLRIGISPGAADLLLASVLPAPGACGPLTFEVASAERIERGITERRYDMGLVLRDFGSPPAGGERLARLPCDVVASRKMATPARPTLAALRGFRWVLCPDGCGYRRALEHGMYGAAQPLDVAAALWGFEQQAALVASGAGLGLLPRLLIEHSPNAAALKVVKVSDFSAAIDLWLIRPDAAGGLDPRLAPLRAAVERSLGKPATFAAAS
jgi:DNA-binding transcriptional LysR family regulator